MSLSRKVLISLLPWLLLLFGFFALNVFKGISGGVAMILGFTMLIDRVMPEKENKLIE